MPDSIAQQKKQLKERLPKIEEIDGWEHCQYWNATHYNTYFLFFPGGNASTEFADRFWQFLHQKQSSTEQRSLAITQEEALSGVISSINRYWIKGDNPTGRIKLETLDRVLCDMGIAGGTYDLDPRGWMAREARSEKERELRNAPIPGGLSDDQLIAYLLLVFPKQSNREREIDLRYRRIMSSFARVREIEAMNNLRRMMERETPIFKD